MAFTTDAFFVEADCAPIWTTTLFVLDTAIDPAPEVDGDPPPFGLAWQTAEGTLSVTCECSTGADAVIPCLATSIVITQSESATQTITVNLIDEDFLFHPEGSGVYNDVMVDGATVDFSVTWGSATRTFFGTFKAPIVSRSGVDNLPTISWVGTCEGDKLLKGKKTFETLTPNAAASAATNKQVLAEMCTAVSIDGDWSRVRTTRLGTPFHRQQLTPGDILQKMLDLTVDEWRTEGRTIEGYDPEAGGRRWEYDPDAFDIVLEQTITPVNNDPIDKVIVVRAVATGTLVPNAEDNEALRLLEFGDGNTVSFDPPLSGITWRYNARDYRAKASYFLFYAGATLIAARAILNPLDYSEELRRARIWNCTSVSFTWGAANPDVDADLTEASGEIVFYGRSSPQTTVGEGEEANAPLDTTTVLPVGDGLNEIELPPNPLFYGSAEMQYFGEKYLRRVGRQQVEHVYRLPLNHMIRLGDLLAIKKDAKLGGSGYTEVRVTAVTHSISYNPADRYTQVTGVKYAAIA